MNSIEIWKPIEDLPEDWQHLVATDLQNLSLIWQKRHDNELKDKESLRQFNEKLSREWAVETGIIEGLYTLDRGTTQVLIEKGIIADLIEQKATNQPVMRVVDILKDHQATLEGLFDFVNSTRELSTSYIKEVHASLTQHQFTTEAVDSLGNHFDVELLHGDWKKQSNNPTRKNGVVHEYCPPEHTVAEMDRLVSMHLAHNELHVSPEVEAAWLHHRFTQIHPFQDGNGRVARVLASLVFLRAGWFPLIINRDDRSDYIDALESADAGSLDTLVSLFAEIQRRAFVNALSLAENVIASQKEGLQKQQLLGSIRERIEAKQRAKRIELENVFGFAETLEKHTYDEFTNYREQLEPELKLLDIGHSIRVAESSEENAGWFRNQIITIAKDKNYFADTGIYRSWVRLQIREEKQFNLVISFHGLGYDFLGILVASAFVYFKQSDADGQDFSQTAIPVARDIFQFAYNEKEEDVVKRYKKWLEESTLLGLTEFQKRL